MLPLSFRTPLKLILPFILAAFISHIWLAVLSAAPSSQPLTDCHATHNNGTTVFTSANAQALRDAITAASAGGTVKVAGTCAGVVAQMGTNQVAVVDKVLTIAGGYTPTNWLIYNPVGNPTVVDAQGGGRVLRLTAAATLQGFTLTNAFISSGGMSWNGGGIESTSALTLTDMVLYNNVITATSGTQRGGGAYIGGAAVIQNSRILNNGARYTGAGIYVEGNATVTDSLFQSNYGENAPGGGRQGGGIRVQGFATIANTDFYSNSIKNEGGGAHAAGGMILTGGTFYNNECMAICSGGAVSTLNSNITISGTQFIGNRAANNGGAVHSNGHLTITNSYFAHNSATQEGGAIAGFDGTKSLTVVNSIFEGNTAVGNGGAIRSFQSVNIANSRFVDNSGANGGGLYLTNQAQMVNSLFASNTTGGNGAGIYTGGNLTVYHTTFASPAPTTGQAIYIASGTTNLTNNIITNYAVGIRRNGGTVTQNYNLFFGNTANTSGTVGGGANSLVGNPAFVNPAGGDYHLTNISAALNRGTNLGITTDFEGDTRPAGGGFDIGFDEAPFATACAVTTGYNYVLGNTAPVNITISSLGTLDCLSVTYVAGNHPNATPGIQTGRYWQISGTDSVGNPATGFVATLTLPTSFVPTANDKVCRYTGAGVVWDCAMSSLGANAITRTGITQFSDWAVGNEVGPTAVHLQRATATSASPTWPLAAVAIALGLASASWVMATKRMHRTNP